VKLSSLQPESYDRWQSFKPGPLNDVEKRRVAVVGLGKQGAKLAKATVDAGFDLVAVCDADAARLKDFDVHGNAQKPRKVASIKELKGIGADVCILATLADNHLTLTRLLHEAGIQAVLCEKPVVNNMADWVALKGFLAQTRMRFAVNHIKLWSADFELARAIVEGESLGKLQRISLRFKSAGFGNIGSHQLAALAFLTGRNLRAVESAVFEGSGAARKKGYSDPNGGAVFDLDGIPVDIDNRSLPVNPPNRLSFVSERGVFELLEEFNLFRLLDRETGEDSEELFKLPWMGSKQSWPVIVHLLQRALLEVSDAPDPRKLDAAFQSVEAIIAAQLSASQGKGVELPLGADATTPFLFS
jgi:predicted dehydrogenase